MLLDFISCIKRLRFCVNKVFGIGKFFMPQRWKENDLGDEEIYDESKCNRNEKNLSN